MKDKIKSQMSVKSMLRSAGTLALTTEKEGGADEIRIKKDSRIAWEARTGTRCSTPRMGVPAVIITACARNNKHEI